MATKQSTETPFSNQAVSEEVIISVMRDAIKRGATMVVRMITATKMRVKGNPFVGDCFKDSTSLYTSGVSYQNCVNNALKRAGQEANFEADASSGMTHDDQINVIMTSTDGQKKYIDLKQERGTKRSTIFIHADGRPFTQYELGVLEPFLIKPSTSKKQAEAGLTEEEQIICIRPDVRNIMSIRQGTEINFVHTEEQETLA